jgi:hypothetical protein
MPGSLRRRSALALAETVALQDARCTAGWRAPERPGGGAASRSSVKPVARDLDEAQS